MFAAGVEGSGFLRDGSMDQRIRSTVMRALLQSVEVKQHGKNARVRVRVVFLKVRLVACTTTW